MADQTDIITLVQAQMSSSVSLITDVGYDSAVNSALSELGWILPENDPTRIWWITKRSLRHATFILYFAAGQNFKYKQINLDQRFDHYGLLIKMMDQEYVEALRTQAALFAGVPIHKQFGTRIRAGFKYDSVGGDLTYNDVRRYIALEDA